MTQVSTCMMEELTFTIVMASLKEKKVIFFANSGHMIRKLNNVEKSHKRQVKRTFYFHVSFNSFKALNARKLQRN